MESIHFTIFTRVLNVVFLNCQFLFIIAGQQKHTDYKQLYWCLKYDTGKPFFLNGHMYICTELRDQKQNLYTEDRNMRRHYHRYQSVYPSHWHHQVINVYSLNCNIFLAFSKRGLIKHFETESILLQETHKIKHRQAREFVHYIEKSMYY